MQDMNQITVALPTTSPIERLKNQALDYLFDDNLNNFQFNSLSSFIDKEIAMYNICHLSAYNETYKKLLKDLELDCPKKEAIITTFNYKVASPADSTPRIRGNIL